MIEAVKRRWEDQYARWMNESLARSREADHYRELAHAMTTANSVITTSLGRLGHSEPAGHHGLAHCHQHVGSGRMVSPLVQLVGSVAHLWPVPCCQEAFGRFV